MGYFRNKVSSGPTEINIKRKNPNINIKIGFVVSVQITENFKIVSSFLESFVLLWVQINDLLYYFCLTCLGLAENESSWILAIAMSQAQTMKCKI